MDFEISIIDIKFDDTSILRPSIPRHMKKIFILIIAIPFLSPAIYAQDEDIQKYLRRREGIKYPNILKVNTIALPMNNISLIYERGLIPRLSASLGASYKYTGGMPRILSTPDDVISFQLDEVQGFGITPELRYYIRTCDNRQLEGLYLGLYFRYTSYGTNANFSYAPVGGTIEVNNANIMLTEYGTGITLGYQLMLWERFSIDLLMFAPRFSNIKIGYEFENQASEEFLDALSESINETIDRFGLDYSVDLKQEGGTKASTSFSFLNVRFGLSLGFAF